MGAFALPGLVGVAQAPKYVKPTPCCLRIYRLNAIGNYLYTPKRFFASGFSFDEDCLHYPSGQRLMLKSLYEGKDKTHDLTTKTNR